MKPVVAHVITGLNIGGAEMMLARLLACHEQSAFRPVVFCLSGQGPVADQINALGITIHGLGMRKGIPDPFVVRRLARLLRTEGAVVVQSWLYHADLIGGLAGRMAGLPVSWGVHNSRLEGNAVGRSLSAVIRACRTASRYLPACVVCVADSAKAAHIEMGYPAAKMLVIPNGFDLDQFRPDPDARRRIRAELGICDQDPVIVIAGRFVPLKNHQLFVEAAGRVLSQHPNTHFVMAGDGLEPGNTELGAWIGRTGRREQFHLLGRRSDMPAILAAADIVALTSDTEAFPLVIGEAMAAGIPCVSTDVGDARYLIADTGRIVPPRDAPAFAAGLSDLVAVPAEERRAMGERARARMQIEFDIRRVAARYDELWYALAAGERPCA